jgi:hypothetical protein
LQINDHFYIEQLIRDHHHVSTLDNDTGSFTTHSEHFIHCRYCSHPAIRIHTRRYYTFARIPFGYFLANPTYILGRIHYLQDFKLVSLFIRSLYLSILNLGRTTLDAILCWLNTNSFWTITHWTFSLYKLLIKEHQLASTLITPTPFKVRRISSNHSLNNLLSIKYQSAPLTHTTLLYQHPDPRRSGYILLRLDTQYHQASTGAIVRNLLLVSSFQRRRVIKFLNT